MRTRASIRATLFVLLLSTVPAFGQAPSAAPTAQTPAAAPRAQEPDERYKADVLLVVAHPDDETAVGAWLAKAAVDDKRRIAVVYTTRGEGGRNAIGVERGAAMGAIREIEARRALATIGVENVWFLDGRDTATQNAMLSLANWPHGDVLEGIVRIMRLTRPEVVMTWMPRNVAGENHGDHQAAGVVTTEAFDMAGDATAFPGQTAPPRLRFPTENMRTWQPKKLYYFSDAFDGAFLDGHGPSFDATAVSPSRKVPYAYLALVLASKHLSQFAPAFPKPLLDAIARNDSAAALEIVRQRGARDPRVRLLLGKSLVGGGATGDVFEGIASGEIPYAPPHASGPADPPAAIGLGGSFDFYPKFWRAHGVAHLGALGPDEIAVRPASELYLNLLLRNTGPAPREVELALAEPLPAGWSMQPLPTRYALAAGEEYLVQPVLTSPAANGTTRLTWVARADGAEIGRLSLAVVVRPGTMPH